MPAINISETLAGIPGNQTGSNLSTRTATVPMLFDAYSGYQLVDPTNNYRLRFEVPAQVTVIRRVRLSISLQPAVYVSQSTTSGGTSGAGTAHAHTVANGAKTVVLDTAGGNYGGGTTATFRDSSGATYLAGVGHVTGTGDPIIGAGANDWTTHLEAAHTHSLPTLNLSAPSTLASTAGSASGATILLAIGTGSFNTVTPPSTQPQPPYGGGGPTDVPDLDFTSQFQKTGIFYEFQITSATIGGIIAQAQLMAELTAS